MRTSILASAVAAGIAVTAPALAQPSTGPGQQQQMQADKQMQEEADKGIKTRDSGESGFVGQQEKPGAAAHPPGQPNPSSSQTTTGPGDASGDRSRNPR
jgi:hypothetical protein